MSNQPFESLKPTTITLISFLDGNVMLDWAFPLLPITKIELPESRRQKQKIKLPHIGIPGAILSLRYKGYTRGIVRSTSKGYFKNSVTIDICVKEKNLCLKLTTNKFQICGASSVEQGREGITYVIDILNQIQDELDYIANNHEKALTTLRQLKDLTRGEPILRPETESLSGSIENEDGSFTIKEPVSDYSIRHVDDFSLYESEDFDPRIAKFLYTRVVDYNYHSHFASDIDLLVTLRTVVTKRLSISSICEAMVNLNYELGFSIDRLKFCNEIDQREGFYAHYINAVEHSVTVQLPYEPPPSRNLLRKKVKQPCHTYIVHQSGHVTQSGPCMELMKDAYEHFNRVVKDIMPKVAVQEVPRRIKYIPIYE